MIQTKQLLGIFFSDLRSAEIKFAAPRCSYLLSHYMFYIMLWISFIITHANYTPGILSHCNIQTKYEMPNNVFKMPKLYPRISKALYNKVVIWYKLMSEGVVIKQVPMQLQQMLKILVSSYPRQRVVLKHILVQSQRCQTILSKPVSSRFVQ